MIESVIKPVQPRGSAWQCWGPIVIVRGYDCMRWFHPERALLVLSALEVAIERDGTSNGPEYHLSISRMRGDGSAYRCTRADALYVLDEFGLDGAEEDNHVPGGVVRNYWRPVATGLIGKECRCKADEPVIVEDKGEFEWRP